ncbi:hypothetical protein Gotri_000509 [Gossypium trilobum]|uniref:Uncharacterized protein n=1 Tax=Gossypium trilobum TaxID=34281 RepID=A0A7J9FBF9_9ROSI|nr:hypothetical protein [Gossypium trilobum]
MENKIAWLSIADGKEEAWQITLEGNEAVSDTEFCLVDVDRVVDGDSSTFGNHLLGCHRLSNGYRSCTRIRVKVDVYSLLKRKKQIGKKDLVMEWDLSIKVALMRTSRVSYIWLRDEGDLIIVDDMRLDMEES